MAKLTGKKLAEIRCCREREANEKRKKSSPPLSFLFLLFCFSLSLVFFWLCVLSLEVFLSQQECVSVSLSPAILMNPRERFSESATLLLRNARFNARKERERERKRRERESARASEHSLFRRKFLSFALSLRHYREELTTTRKTEYSFLSCAEENRKLACFPWETIIMRTKRRRKNHRRR